MIFIQSGYIFSQNSLSDTSKIKLGFGVSSNFYSSLSSQNSVSVNSSFSIPIFISSNFKIEPFLGYSNTDSKGKTTIYTQNIASSENEIYYEHKNFIIGSGLFYSKEVKNLMFHFGSNFAYIIYKQNQKVNGSYYYSEDKNDGKGFIIAPTVGCEYFLKRYISLGIEARFEWMSLNTDGETTYPGVTDLKHTNTNSIKNFNTQGFMIIRFYPWSN
jgi:hypothetical protein